MTVNIDLASVGGKMLAPATYHGTQASPEIWWFGWIPPTQVNSEAAEQVDAAIQTAKVNRENIDWAFADAQHTFQPFKISGKWQLDQKRYALWQSANKVHGKHLRYNWQVTGSCIGAGGGNMLKTQQCVEIANGDAEEFLEVWWPWTYGLSRMLGGMRGRGEGSFGSTWARAIMEMGSFAREEAPNLPEYREVEGWLQLTAAIELEWSDGNAKKDQYKKIGKEHTATMALLNSADDCIAALANGYALTQASMFGFRSSKVVGDPPVRIAPWDGAWGHQTYVDEYWDHPTEGEIFRWGNNWGPFAHGNPTGDEPPGGVYIRKDTMDKICKSGEVFAFSMYNGFPARKISWLI